jgi:hypothetical protein
MFAEIAYISTMQILRSLSTQKMRKGQNIYRLKGDDRLSGPLANPRHEQFCLLFVRGLGQGEAYEQAGYKSTGRRSLEVCASRLMRHAAVRRRINELQSYAADSECLTVAGLIREAALIQREAQRAGNQSAAVAALTAKAKIAGLWVERQENENTNLNYAISDQLPTEEQWQRERVVDSSSDIVSDGNEPKALEK